MSLPEIIILATCIVVPMLTLSLFAVSSKNKKKIADKKAKENIKPKTDEEKELEALKMQIEFEKKYEEERQRQIQEQQKSHGVGGTDDDLDQILAELEKDDLPPVPKFSGDVRQERPRRHFSGYDIEENIFSEEDNLKEEIDKISPKMKAILFADLMKPKYKE